MSNYKPDNYNALSPYLVIDGAKEMINFLVQVFDGKILRRYDHDNGLIAHVEVLIDDTVIMISDSTADFPANKTMLHLYVPDVMETYKNAIQYGCKKIEEPINKLGDPDTRGSFFDLAGNYWAVSTQKRSKE